MAVESSHNLVEVKNLKVYFPVRGGLFRRKKLYVRAVDGVSFSIGKKEIFGLAGESGSGKTTIGRALLRVVDITEGEILFDGKDLVKMDEKELRKLRPKMQMIFQDPYSALNPRMTVYDIVAEPLRVHGYEDVDLRVEKALREVGLSVEEFGFRFPHELSGGQRQRVAIARVLVLEPDFIVADEPTSMLDVSVRSGILELLLDLRDKEDVTYLFITHDLALARYVTDRLAVMYLGKFMEVGSTEEVISNPMHPYTQALISSFPEPSPELKKERRIILKGEIPSPINIPPGCRFHPRCPYAKEICREKEPEMTEVSSGHLTACHMVSRK